MADIKISALPTDRSVNDADIFVMDQGLVTKTATRAQILASIKDANNNITANAFFNNLASITASGTPVVLTVASAPVSLVTGSGGQVIKLPDATTLTNGTIFSFNNNQSSGAISVNNNSNTLVVSIPSGGYTTVVLLSNATAAGSWDRHDQSPANVSWSTNTLDYPNGSITNATWNGNTVAINRGGTGATSQAAALASLAAMATSERANYIPTTQLGSLATTAQLAGITPASIGAMATTERGNYATTTQLAAITPASIGAMATSERATYATTTQVASITASSLGALSTAQAVTIAQGGTGATTQAAALIALAAMATSERVNYIPTTQLSSLATTTQLAAITPASIGAIPTSTLASLATTTQLAAITPASIGAIPTSAQAGFATTTQVAAITASSLGALSTAQAVTIAQGGTGQTTQQAALNALAAGVTANYVLKGNGTNVILAALTSADIPTLPISKLSGVAASGANTDLTSVALSTGTVSTTPTGVTDIVNKAYADSIGSGINFHDACDYGTLAVLSPAATYAQPGGAGVGVNATLTGQTNIALQVDGVTVAVGKRILVKNQTSQFQNGVYNVTQQGDGSTVPYILTRATDYDTSGSGTNEVQAGDFILILSSTLANTAWVQQTPAPIYFGVTNIAFTQFAAAASGVSSFNTSLTGLTPSTNTTGAVTLAGALGIASGGTGTTTQQAALNAISGTQTAGYHFRSDGTNVSLQPLSLADVTAGTLGVVYGGTGATTQVAALTNLGAQAVLTTAAPLALTLGGSGSTSALGALTNIGAQAALTTASPLALTAGGTGTTSAVGALTNLGAQAALTTAAPLAISLGGTGAITNQSAISNLGVGMRMIEAQFTAGLVGTMNTGVSPNTFTITAVGAQNPDGYTVSVGDIVAFPLQGGGTSTQNGFWQVTTLGDAVTQAVFTRPSWFTGTVKNTMYMTRFGATQAGYVMSVMGAVGNAEIVVGTGTISVYRVSYRSANAITGVNTFTGIQTFQANGTAVNKCPFSFSASAGLMTATQAHAVEWDNSQMYVTNSAAERLPVATSKAQINAQTGTTYTLALADAGYLVTLNNSAAITLTVPPVSSVPLPNGTQILILQLGTGQITISPGSLVTLYGRNGLKTSGQFSVVCLIKVINDAWVVSGDSTV